MHQDIAGIFLGRFRSKTKLFLKIELRRLLFLIILSQLFQYKKAFSQEEKWVGMIGIFPTKQYVTDKTYNSLSYQGLTLAGSALLGYSSLKAEYKLEIYYTAGNLSSSVSGLKSVHFNYTNIDFTNLYNLGGPGTSNIVNKLGAAINIFSHRRNYEEFINNSRTSDFSASLSVAFETAVYFKRRLKGFSISNNVYVPFLSAVNQPVFGANEFSVPANDDSRFKSFFRNARLLSLPSFLRIKNQFSIRKEIEGNHVISFVYVIDYYRIDHFRDVRQINHRFGINYGYKF